MGVDSTNISRYSKDEIEILHNAIKVLNEISPVMPSVDEACKFYVDLWDTSAKISETKVEYGEQSEHDCVIARNIALRYLYLSLMIGCSKHKDAFLLSSIIQTISDTIIAIIKLAEDGMEYQAFIMIRTLFELFMTLLIVTESPEKRKAYKSAETKELSYKVWREAFSKAKFIKMLEQYADNYPGLFEPAKTWVTETYGFLSSFVHNDSVNVMLYTKPIFDNDGISHHSFWGEYVTRKGEIYRRLVSVVSPCDLLFFSMLSDPKIDLSMKTLICDEEDIKGTINIYWTMDGLRKVCMILLSERYAREKIKEEIENEDCPFFKEKNEP